MKIELHLLEYSKRRNLDVKEIYLKLEENFIHYKVVANYEVLDEDTAIWKETRANYRWVRRRNSISEINLYFDNLEGLWSLGVDFAGVSNTNDWFFKDPNKAYEIYKVLLKYMVMKPLSEIEKESKIQP